MKTLGVFFLLLLGICAAHAQLRRPDGLAEIKWGMSLADAKAAMSAREGVVLARTDETQLLFRDGEFAGMPALSWQLDFDASGFLRGSVVLDSKGDWKGMIARLKKQLADKYGSFTRETLGGEMPRVVWEFAPNQGDRQAIALEIARVPASAGVRVTYQRAPSERLGK